jgi:hypothetical protein
MKTYLGVEVKLRAFISSALDLGEYGQVHPSGKNTGTHCIGDWVGHRAGLDAVVKKKFPASAGNPTLVAQFVTWSH